VGCDSDFEHKKAKTAYFLASNHVNQLNSQITTQKIQLNPNKLTVFWCESPGEIM